MVERSQYTILDGHHRWEALRKLNCRRIPVYLVNYDSNEVTLTTWPGATPSFVRKEEVLDHARRGVLFPPKTTRHVFSFELPNRPVKLEELL